MKFSAFSGIGFLRFSSREPRGLSIYRALVTADGGNFGEEFDSPMGGTRYARAMALARARATLERVENNSNPLLAQETLTVLEAMYGLTPEANTTLTARRTELAARYLVAQPPTQENIETALELIIDGHAGAGSFLEWRPMPVAEAEEYPTNALNGPGTFKLPTARRKLIQFPSYILTGAQTVAYNHVSGDGNPPSAGEEWVFEPGRLGCQEKVTITGHSTVSGQNFITATFARSHDEGTIATVGPFPFWMSTKQHGLVIVTTGKAGDPILRRKVTNFLELALSGASTFDIVEAVAANPANLLLTRVGQPSIGVAILS